MIFLRNFVNKGVNIMFFNRMKSVSTTELQGMLSEKPQILDVREPYEFKNGHIPGAKNLPLAKVGTFTGQGPVYVICQSGMRSSSATKQLTKMGVEAINVNGGMNQWRGAVK